MSSFVISKRCYIQCAGLLAGIADLYNRGPYTFWVYDRTHNRNSTTEDYREQAALLYRLNAESVQHQYGDEEPEQDGNEYADDFRRGFRLGRDAAMRGPLGLMPWIKRINRFFRSVLYQTEEENSAEIMRRYFWLVMTALLDKITHDDDAEGYWGSFGNEAPRQVSAESEDDGALTPAEFAEKYAGQL